VGHLYGDCTLFISCSRKIHSEIGRPPCFGGIVKFLKATFKNWQHFRTQPGYSIQSFSSYNFVHFHQILCLTNFRIYGKVSLLINILTTVNLLGTFKVVQLRFGSRPSLRSGLKGQLL